MSDHHHQPGEDEIHIIPMQNIMLEDFETDEGFILDIGAGGEGIIELLKGRDVIGIDRSKRELEETQNESLKIVMDAKELKFLDETFGTVTLFFTFMYMSWPDIDIILDEILRVLKNGGQLLIWDAICQVPEETSKKYFLVPLTITLPDARSIETGYGSTLRSQSLLDFITRLEGKFTVLEQNEREGHFFLRAQKT